MNDAFANSRSIRDGSAMHLSPAARAVSQCRGDFVLGHEMAMLVSSPLSRCRARLVSMVLQTDYVKACALWPRCVWVCRQTRRVSKSHVASTSRRSSCQPPIGKTSETHTAYRTTVIAEKKTL